MRLGGRRTSSNIERGGGGGLPIVGGGSLGCGGLILVIIVALVFGVNPLQLLGGGEVLAPSDTRTNTPGATGDAALRNETDRFVSQVLASTEDRWAEIFRASGETYTPATLVFYDRSGRSGCGLADAAMGPFYCPADSRIYLDTTFFDELKQRFGAPGDFAQAYVIAHEVGHHIQAITGTADRVRRLQARASEAEGNALQVKMELQADCYGVWANRERAILEPGDIEEGMRAAEAIGDDILQQAAGRRPVPESFTHGTSSQRMSWLKRGLESGDPAHCDTFG